jgi:hypothetical protein
MSCKDKTQENRRLSVSYMLLLPQSPHRLSSPNLPLNPMTRAATFFLSVIPLLVIAAFSSISPVLMNQSIRLLLTQDLRGATDGRGTSKNLNWRLLSMI